ncbi:MAG: hypothetical protein JJT76_01520 [Clostridiaceae bacterium]|nr:hypothetical protein [Clostridiaceae bacterium]
MAFEIDLHESYCYGAVVGGGDPRGGPVIGTVYLFFYFLLEGEVGCGDRFIRISQ